MVGWIKMPLGTEVGLGSGDIVLDGDPAPPTEKLHSSPPLFIPCLFRRMSIVAKRLPISATAELFLTLLTLALDNWRKRSNCQSFGRLIVDDVRVMPGQWLGSVLWVSVSALMRLVG